MRDGGEWSLERERAMIHTISDVLMSGDFNPIDVSVNRPRRPHVNEQGKVFWTDTGVCIVTIVGAVPIDDVDISVVEDEDVDLEGLVIEEDEEWPDHG